MSFKLFLCRNFPNISKMQQLKCNISRFLHKPTQTITPQWQNRATIIINSGRRFMTTTTNNAKLNNSSTKKFRKSDFLRFIGLMKPERWKLLGAVCLLFISSGVSMVVPFSIGRVLDLIYSNDRKEKDVEEAKTKLNGFCLFLLGIFIFGAVCNFGRVYLMTTTGYRMTQDLRKTLFASIMRQEIAWFDQRSTGELVNRLSADTQLVGNALSANISDGLRSLIMVATGSGMMVYMSPQLAAVGLAVVPPIAGLTVIYGRFVKRITRDVQDSLARASQVADERLANMRTVKSFSRETKEFNNYSREIGRVLGLGYKEAAARAVFFGLTGFSGNVIILSVLYYGGTMISDQTITVGQLSAFLMYAAYVGISIGGLSGFFAELNKSLGAASRLWEIIDRHPTLINEGQSNETLLASNSSVNDKLKQLNGELVFKDVSFSYPSRPDAAILQKLNLIVSPGKTVAVVGPSGSGKSTLAQLLLRLYDPDQGEILIDGQNIKRLDVEWLRSQVAIVSQEPILFSCSIRDNILYGLENDEELFENDDRLVAIAKEANVYEFVQKLPDGFDTLVGERGVMLSGGQKQRVAIARALIRDPKILLLDEATSALDATSEHLVKQALQRLMQNRTVLTIAHRLSTIQTADSIVVLQNGQIAEEGAYADLIARSNSLFGDLMRHQQKKQAKSS